MVWANGPRLTEAGSPSRANLGTRGRLAFRCRMAARTAWSQPSPELLVGIPKPGRSSLCSRLVKLLAKSSGQEVNNSGVPSRQGSA